MPVTEPKNLAFPGRNGDTEETAVTNDPANKGFPAKTQGGDLVFIVDQRYEHQKKVLVDGNGNEYLDDNVLGFLVPYSSEELPEEGEVDGHIVAQDGPEITESIPRFIDTGNSDDVSDGNEQGTPENDAA